jgi:anti-anti-sigma factor
MMSVPDNNVLLLAADAGKLRVSLEFRTGLVVIEDVLESCSRLPPAIRLSQMPVRFALEFPGPRAHALRRKGKIPNLLTTIRMELSIIDAGDDYTHLVLSGKMDNLGVEEIEEKFLGHVVGNKKNAVIDISGVTFTGSNGLRLFLRAVKGLRPEKKVVILLNPQPLMKAVLLDSGIQDALIIENNTESALSRAKA